VLALVLASVPVGLLATDRFPDVPTSNPHHDDVNQIAAAGITTGFPDGTYKPDAFVTRGQMATFLARTAGLGGRVPVANAATALTANTATNATNAVNAQNAASATTAQTAGNAQQLDGQPASYYQPAGQPIANAVNATNAGNANTVDGKSANDLVRLAAATGGSGEIAGPCCAPRTNMAVLTITAPAAGYIQIVARASVTFPAGGGTMHAGIFLDNDPNWHNPTSATRENHLVVTPTSGTHEFVVAYRLPVGAGVRTVTFWGHYHGAAVLSYANATITGLYVPFGGSGTTALEADE
jgi:hypothetical protein